MNQKDDDFTEELFVGSSHDTVLFMTDRGRVYRLKGYQVPEGGRTAKGSHIVNLLQLQEGEQVTGMLRQPADIDEEHSYLTTVTRQGVIQADAAFAVPQHPQSRPQRRCAQRRRQPGLEPSDQR